MDTLLEGSLESKEEERERVTHYSLTRSLIYTFGMVYAGPMSVLLDWNWDRKSATICGRGTPAGSFIDG